MLKSIISKNLYQSISFCSQFLNQPKIQTQVQQKLSNFQNNKFNIYLQRNTSQLFSFQKITQTIAQFPERFNLLIYQNEYQLELLYNQCVEENLPLIITFQNNLDKLLEIIRKGKKGFILCLCEQQIKNKQNQILCVGNLQYIINYIKQIGHKDKQNEDIEEDCIEQQNQFGIFFDTLRYTLRNPIKKINELFDTEIILIYLPKEEIYVKYKNMIKNQSLKFVFYKNSELILKKLNEKQQNYSILIIGTHQLQLEINQSISNKSNVKFIINNRYSNYKSNLILIETNENQQILYILTHLPNHRYKQARTIRQNVGIYFHGKNDSLTQIAQQIRKNHENDKRINIYMYLNLNQVRNNILKNNEMGIIVTDEKSNTAKQIQQFIMKIQEKYNNKKIKMIIFKNSQRQTNDISYKNLIFMDSSKQIVLKFLKTIHSNQQIQKSVIQQKNTHLISANIKPFIFQQQNSLINYQIQPCKSDHQSNQILKPKIQPPPQKLIPFKFQTQQIIQYNFTETQIQEYSGSLEVLQKPYIKNSFHIRLCNKFETYGLQKNNMNDLIMKTPKQLEQLTQQYPNAQIVLYYDQETKKLLTQKILENKKIKLIKNKYILKDSESEILSMKNSQTKPKLLKIQSQNLKESHISSEGNLNYKYSKRPTKKLPSKYHKLDLSKEENCISIQQNLQQYKKSTFLLPLNSLKAMIIVLYNKQNCSIKDKIYKYLQNQVKLIEYDCLNQLKQTSKDYQNQVQLILFNDNQISEKQIECFNERIWFINYNTNLLDFNKKIEIKHSKIIYATNIIKQVENYISHLIYRSFKRLEKMETYNRRSLSKKQISQQSHQNSKSVKKYRLLKASSKESFDTSFTKDNYSINNRKMMKTQSNKKLILKCKNSDYYGQ